MQPRVFRGAEASLADAASKAMEIETRQANLAKGVLSGGFRSERGTRFSTSDWIGKTYDLTSAYKQFGVSSSDRDILRILTLDHNTGRPVLLGANELPFGATGSVSSFLKVSMAIWYIGVRALGLCWTAFFDDSRTHL